MRFFAVFLVLLCVGCDTLHKFPEKFLIETETGFTDCEVELIIDAIKKWEDATDGIVDVNIELTTHVGNDRHSIKPAWSWLSTIDTLSSEWTAGYTFTHDVWQNDKPGQILLIVDRLRPRDAKIFLGVTMHELGHHYGLGHSSYYRKSIMHSALYQEDHACIHAHDLLQFCFLYGCVPPAEDPQCDPVPDCKFGAEMYEYM